MAAAVPEVRDYMSMRVVSVDASDSVFNVCGHYDQEQCRVCSCN